MPLVFDRDLHVDTAAQPGVAAVDRAQADVLLKDGGEGVAGELANLMVVHIEGHGRTGGAAGHLRRQPLCGVEALQVEPIDLHPD